MVKRVVKTTVLVESYEVERRLPRPLTFTGAGRFPTAPGDTIAAVTCIDAVMIWRGVSTPDRLQRQLEPEAFIDEEGKYRQGSGKYRHILNGRSGLTKQTFKKSKFKDRKLFWERYLKDPLRLLLQWNAPTQAEYLRLLDNLRPSLKCYAYHYLACLHDPLSTPNYRLMLLRAIRAEGDTDALACLILLLLETDKIHHGDAVTAISREASLLCIILTLQPPLHIHFDLLWGYLRDWYLVRADKYGKTHYSHELNGLMFGRGNFGRIIALLMEMGLLNNTISAYRSYIDDAIEPRFDWKYNAIIEAKKDNLWKSIDDVPEPISLWINQANDYERVLRIHARVLMARSKIQATRFKLRHYIDRPLPWWN